MISGGGRELATGKEGGKSLQGSLGPSSGLPQHLGSSPDGGRLQGLLPPMGWGSLKAGPAAHSPLMPAQCQALKKAFQRTFTEPASEAESWGLGDPTPCSWSRGLSSQEHGNLFSSDSIFYN